MSSKKYAPSNTNGSPVIGVVDNGPNRSTAQKRPTNSKGPNLLLNRLIGLVVVMFIVFWIWGSIINKPIETEYEKATRIKQERAEEEETQQRLLDRRCESLNEKLNCELCTLTDDERAILKQCVAKRVQAEYPYSATRQRTPSEIDQADLEYWRKRAEKLDEENDAEYEKGRRAYIEEQRRAKARR